MFQTMSEKIYIVNVPPSYYNTYKKEILTFKDYLEDLVDKNKINKLIKLGIDNIYVWSMDNYYTYYDVIDELDIKTYIVELLLNLGINIIPPSEYKRDPYYKIITKYQSADNVFCYMKSSIAKYCDVKNEHMLNYIHFRIHSAIYNSVNRCDGIHPVDMMINDTICKIIHNHKLLNLYPSIIEYIIDSETYDKEHTPSYFENKILNLMV